MGPIRTDGSNLGNFDDPHVNASGLHVVPFHASSHGYKASQRMRLKSTNGLTALRCHRLASQLVSIVVVGCLLPFLFVELHQDVHDSQSAPDERSVRRLPPFLAANWDEDTALPQNPWLISDLATFAMGDSNS